MIQFDVTKFNTVRAEVFCDEFINPYNFKIFLALSKHNKRDFTSKDILKYFDLNLNHLNKKLKELHSAGFFVIINDNKKIITYRIRIKGKNFIRGVKLWDSLILRGCDKDKFFNGEYFKVMLSIGISNKKEFYSIDVKEHYTILDQIIDRMFNVLIYNNFIYVVSNYRHNKYKDDRSKYYRLTLYGNKFLNFVIMWNEFNYRE